MTAHVRRRTFLAGATGIALAVSACAGSPVHRLGGRRVVVLGAGLAGLSAAHHLVRGGYEVTVLEARDRPGGRVQTIREPFVGGGYAEAGALRIPDVHTRTQRYLAELGLADRLFEYNEAGERLWYLDGVRFTSPSSPQGWPLPKMSPAERADPASRLATYLGPALEMAGDVRSPGWPGDSPRAAALDACTLAEFARQRGASEAWLRYLYAAEGGVGGINVLAFAGQEAGLTGHRRTFGLRGGNDQLPRALASRLGDRVRYRSRVRRVVSGAERVVIGYQDTADRRQELVADYAICTLPFPALRGLELDGLADAKRRAVEQYQLAAGARGTSRPGAGSGATTRWARWAG